MREYSGQLRVGGSKKNVDVFEKNKSTSKHQCNGYFIPPNSLLPLLALLNLSCSVYWASFHNG